MSWLEALLPYPGWQSKLLDFSNNLLVPVTRWNYVSHIQSNAIFFVFKKVKFEKDNILL